VTDSRSPAELNYPGMPMPAETRPPSASDPQAMVQAYGRRMRVVMPSDRTVSPFEGGLIADRNESEDGG
jgi:hypothetical protein